MMKRTLSLSALLLLGALPLGALAAQHAQAPASIPPAAAPVQTPAIFSQLDLNQDRFVTLEEAKRSADVSARFKTLDANGDGKISADEFKKGEKEKM